MKRHLLGEKNTNAQRRKGKKNATFPANPDPTANMHRDRVKKKGGHVTHVIRKEAKKRGKGNQNRSNTDPEKSSGTLEREAFIKKG